VRTPLPLRAHAATSCLHELQNPAMRGKTQGLCARYERHHRVIYSPEALQAAVRLSTKYIQDRQLPDKVTRGVRH